jgi:4-hydroxy-2-oxoheptanedioate aldolase
VRTNLTKEALRAGQNVVCIQPHFPSPELVEFLGHLGFDCVFIDAEHGGVGVERAQELVRAADASGVPTLVRVPRNEPETILRYLDIGSGGVLVPHVKSAEHAEAAVRASKFAPRGIRGAHAATRAAGYGLTQSSRAYFAQANAETLVAVMIEDASAVESFEQIAATDGLDLCVLGREDLAMSLGYPGELDHPEVARLTELVLQAARRAGLPLGITTPDGFAVSELFERGFQFVVVSASRLLAGTAREVLARAASKPARIAHSFNPMPCTRNNTPHETR